MTDKEYVETVVKRVGDYKTGFKFCFENIFSPNEWKEIKNHGLASLRFAEHVEREGIAERLDAFEISSHKNSVRSYKKL